MSLLRTLMAPIGRPENVTGVRPIFKKPEPIIPNLPVQVPPREFIEEPKPPRSGIPSIGGTIFGPPLPPGPITRPPIGRPIPPISIGGIGGIDAINPINIGQPVPSPIDKLPSPGAGVPSELLPIKGGPRPIPIQPITRPVPPIGGVFDDSLQNIDLPIDDRASRPRGPIVGGIVAGGGGIDYGGGEGPALLPDLTFGRGGGLIPTPKRIIPIPPQDFGFGPGVRPSELRDKLGNIVVGSAGVTPPEFAEYRKSPIQESFADFLARTGTGTTTPTTSPVVPPVITPEPVIEPVVTPEPVIEPAPTTPAAVAPDVGAVPQTGLPTPSGAVSPVLQEQRTAELLTDPLIRSLYFGTADQPGFFNQLQQAGANLIASDVPLQQTAGLTPLELLARQQAVAGLGGFEPFLQQNRNLVNQAIAQSRRAEELQDPYYTQAEQIYQDTMGAYDPSMTQQFYNPFEDAVVQQTISDVLESGEQQDIAARAREIGAGAFGGSRARLGAMERREALGEGLAQALGRIRQQGFSEAQRTGLSEFARQQQAKRTGAQGLIGIGTGRGSAASDLASQLAGFGREISGIGQTQEQLRAGQRGELSGFGATGRGIAETGLGRIFEQQMGQQMRPLGVLGQIGGLLPGYKQASTQIDSQYGLPKDPTAEGLGAAFSAYASVAPKGSG